MSRFFASVIAVVLLWLSTAAFAPAQARQLVIFRSHDYISRNYEIQHFVDTLTLQAGQLEVPLTMTIYNGSVEAPSYKWFRILINGEIIATEQDLRGREEGSKDVSGIIRGSDNQVQIEAGGVPGAHLCWTLNADQMELTGAEPQQVLPGQQFKLTGSNIPSTLSLLSVTVNGKAARVLSASTDSILVQMPESASIGVNEVQVRSGNQSTNAISVSVVSRPVPEILGTNCWMAPPGGTINISGRNFSPNAVENKVFFGQVAAQVNSASSNELTVVVPNWNYGPNQLNIPISVEVNGMRSANTFPFDIGPMYHGATPSFGHD